jgi:hypothetical protein
MMAQQSRHALLAYSKVMNSATVIPAWVIMAPDNGVNFAVASRQLSGGLAGTLN